MKYILSSLPQILLPLLLLTSYKTLCHYTRTSTPLIVVISQSMYPAFTRGDLLLISNRTADIRVGDIVTAWFEKDRLPMVHRVIAKYPALRSPSNSSTKTIHHHPPNWQTQPHYMTKGDNNPSNDLTLYPPNQPYMLRSDIIGCVRFYIPFVGWARLVFDEIWWLGYALGAVWVGWMGVGWVVGDGDGKEVEGSLKEGKGGVVRGLER